MEALPIRRVCQVEIRTRDIQKASAFYRQVFDWQIHIASPDYALIDTGAEPVGAFMKTPDENWPVGTCNYVLVPDCEKAGLFAQSLGAKVIIQKAEVPGAGWFVGTLDPWGNELFFWQPRGEFAPQLRGSGKNPFSWLEIPVHDIQQGVGFYMRLVRWRFATVEGQPDYVYTEDGGFSRGIGLVGGAAARGRRGATNYVTVTDIDEAARRILAGGGEVVQGPLELSGEGRFLVFLDPERIRWGLFQPA